MMKRLLQAISAAAWLALTGSQPSLSAETSAAAVRQNASSTSAIIAPGDAIERTLRGGETHAFEFELDAGEFVYLILDQRGADVSVRLHSPASVRLVASDSPNGTTGAERVAYVATAGGRYRLEVVSEAPAADTTARAYRIQYVNRRAARPDDVRHAEAERLFAEAGPQLRQNTAASRATARERYSEAAAIFGDLGFKYERGLCLFSLGTLELRAGNPRAAVPLLTEARSLFDSQTDAMYASVVNALGGSHDLLGDPESAMTSYRAALRQIAAAGDAGREAIIRNNIGKLYADIADWPRALDEYRRALPLFQQTGDRRREGLALYNIGMSYSSMGDRERSAEYLRQSLAIRREIGDRAGQADSLTRLGVGETLGGRPEAAIEYIEQALPFRVTVGDRNAEGISLASLGEAQLAAGRSDQAIASLERAVALRADDRRGQALAIASLAEAHLAAGHSEQALDRASEAASVLRTAGDRKGLGRALPVLARAQQRAGQLDAALDTALQALAVLEDVRGGATSLDMRAAYVGRYQDTYTLAIELLMRLHERQPASGFDARALQASERAKARSLIDMLGESGTEVRHRVDRALIDRERELARLLNGKADRLLAVQAARSSGEADLLAKDAQRIEAEYDEIRGRIRATNPEYAAITQPQPLEVDAIRRDVLDDDTALVEYALGPDASYVWVLDRQGLKTYRLAPRAEIEQAARHAYELVTSRATNVPRETTAARAQRIAASDAALPAALRRVSDLVLAPITTFPTTTRLLVVADGALQYLPFEMLPAPRRAQAQPLVVDFEITALPSASTLAVHRTQLARRPVATKGVAVFADPVFAASDARVRLTASRVASATPAASDTQTRLLTQTDDAATPGFGNIARLRFTDDEAKAILAAAQGRQNLSAIGFDATKAAATDAGLGAYRYLHFATHGFLDTARPSLSAIALSLVAPDGTPQEGFLRAHELYNLNLSADLVVLSACETGLGKEIRGEGLIGLTRAFMYAGAARVIVSLWSVSDRATSSLMSRLYREMLRNGRTPAASLRAAQLALRSDARWRHPYFWAAFTIQGDL